MISLAQTLNEFLDEFLVQCPKCARPANVALSKEVPTKGQARLTCLSCGHNEFRPLRSKWNSTIFGAPVDPYFHLPLWLQIDCGGEILWAYNRRHLAYLKLFTNAKLRDSGPSGRRNLSNKLPKWMGLAKNRTRILRAIHRLDKKL
jgi:hypothetical protein